MLVAPRIAWGLLLEVASAAQLSSPSCPAARESGSARQWRSLSEMYAQQSKNIRRKELMST
jgi:hypothetical protein